MQGIRKWVVDHPVASSAVGGVVAGPALLVAVPWALGFGGAGIVAGSYATGWMSSVAVANGGGVATTSMVAMMQSVGAAGFATSTYAGAAAATSAASAGAAKAAQGATRWVKSKL